MRALATVVCVLAATAAAAAHSGPEFFALEDADLGHPGGGTLGLSYDVERYGGGDEVSSELALYVTPFRRLALGADVRFAENADGDWVYAGVTPRLQFALTDPDSGRRLRLGASIGYQFAEDISAQETVTTFEEITVYRDAPVVGAQAAPPATDPGAGSGEPDCNPLFDLDCEPAPNKVGKGRAAKHSGHTVVVETAPAAVPRGGGGAGQIAETIRVPRKAVVTRGGGGHRGIHNHDARQWEGRMLAEYDLGKTKVVANLIATFPEDDHAYWGYGVGARRQLGAGGLSVGVEAVGDFLSGGEHELIGTLGYDLDHGLMLRAGAGVGLTGDSPDATFRVGMRWSF